MYTKEELAFLKEERKIMAENKTQALADFKNQVPIADKEFERMAFVRSQYRIAERDKYAARGRLKTASKKERKEAEEEFRIAEQVCADARERFEAQNAIFKVEFEKKQYYYEIYCYFRDEYRRLDNAVSNYYRSFKKKKYSNPPKNEAGE